MVLEHFDKFVGDLSYLGDELLDVLQQTGLVQLVVLSDLDGVDITSRESTRKHLHGFITESVITGFQTAKTSKTIRTLSLKLRLNRRRYSDCCNRVSWIVSLCKQIIICQPNVTGF